MTEQSQGEPRRGRAPTKPTQADAVEPNKPANGVGIAERLAQLAERPAETAEASPVVAQMPIAQTANAVVAAPVVVAAAPAPKPAAKATLRPSRTPISLTRRCPISSGCRATSRCSSSKAAEALAAMMKPVEHGDPGVVAPKPELAEVFATLGRVAEYYAVDARRAMEAQSEFSTQFLELWGSTLKKLGGEAGPDVVPTDKGDKRFNDPEWSKNPYFDFIKQAYVLTSRWADELVRRADEMDPHTREKAAFYMKQVTSALSPSNFVATNPELLRATLVGKRREPRARHEDDGRGHRSRPRPSAHPAGRRRQVQARRRPRGDAGQGDLSATI